eukprot:3638782-Rhodomonas_salina.1
MGTYLLLPGYWVRNTGYYSEYYSDSGYVCTALRLRLAGTRLRKWYNGWRDSVAGRAGSMGAVSYTHLTLPTICSV